MCLSRLCFCMGSRLELFRVIANFMVLLSTGRMTASHVFAALILCRRENEGFTDVLMLKEEVLKKELVEGIAIKFSLREVKFDLVKSDGPFRKNIASTTYCKLLIEWLEIQCDKREKQFRLFSVAGSSFLIRTGLKWMGSSNRVRGSL